MFYLAVAVCVALVGIIAFCTVKYFERRGLQRRKDRVYLNLQEERPRYLPFEQVLLGKSTAPDLTPELAQMAQRISQNLKQLESWLDDLDHEMDLEKLSNAESKLAAITCLIDDLVKRSKNQ